MARASIRPLVIDYGTDVTAVRRLRAATNLDAGVVVAAVPPNMRRSYELTWELLFAFGKESDVSGAGRDETLNWEVLVAWIVAHRVEHIVLVDAQWLRRVMLEEMIGLASVTATTLWLVAQYPLEDEYERALEGWFTEPATVDDLEPVIVRGEARAREAAGAEFPVVPPENFMTFRAEARRRLDGTAFEVVDARYRTAFMGAQEWICAQASLDEDSVLTLVRSQLHACECAEEMFTVLRAIQAASFRSGWLLSVDLDRLVVTAERAAAAAIHSPHTWVRLRAYREPYRGAACALAAADLALETMTSLRLADVSDDGRVVRPVGRAEPVTVPVGAEIYLRALVAQRRIQGALGADLLFGSDDGPLLPKYLADAIRRPITEVGVPLYSQQVERAELDPARWSRRWGLSVQVLS